MKKLISHLFRFLGGITFALLLIGSTAFMVALGTFIESQTGSHEAAALWTYKHPFFFLLLSLFFINILFSALHRWPFQKKHLPFLITHLGLLMILAGVFLKSILGVQGQMTLLEGNGSNKIIIPHTYALKIEKKNEEESSQIALESFSSKIHFSKEFPELSCKIIGYTPDVKKEFSSWIKGNYLYLSGIPPLAFKKWQKDESLPTSQQFRLSPSHTVPFNLVCIETEDVNEAIEKMYLKDLMLVLVDKKKSEKLEIPLKDALKTSFSFNDKSWSLSLDIENLPANLLLKCDNNKWTYFLNSEKALMSTHPTLEIDLKRAVPSLIFLKNKENKAIILGFDSYGRFYKNLLNQTSFKSYIAYDQGFGGYEIEIDIPFPNFPTDRQSKELAHYDHLTNQINSAIHDKVRLSPPLEWFKQHCKLNDIDFSKAFITFLGNWKQSGGLLYKGDLPFNIDLKNEEEKTCHWIAFLSEEFEPFLKKGEKLKDLLKKWKWPFEYSDKDNLSFLEFCEQITTFGNQLPLPPKLIENPALYFSSYLAAYGINYQLLDTLSEKENETFDYLESYWKNQNIPVPLSQSLTLHTYLNLKLSPKETSKIVEERIPGLILLVESCLKKEKVLLAYDPTCCDLKWPVLGGDYKIAFQPLEQLIPHYLHLKEARQFNYPDSNQAYSYESDLSISNDQNKENFTLSMNHVYETEDNYRFYLAGIATTATEAKKKIQLAVNRDPFKYHLTYLGGLLVSIGAISLLWRGRNRNI